MSDFKSEEIMESEDNLSTQFCKYLCYRNKGTLRLTLDENR